MTISGYGLNSTPVYDRGVRKTTQKIYMGAVNDPSVGLIPIATLYYTLTAVAQWLWCCATNRNVAGSIPAGVSGFFIDIKSFRSHYGPGGRLSL